MTTSTRETVTLEVNMDGETARKYRTALTGDDHDVILAVETALKERLGVEPGGRCLQVDEYEDDGAPFDAADALGVDLSEVFIDPADAGRALAEVVNETAGRCATVTLDPGDMTRYVISVAATEAGTVVSLPHFHRSFMHTGPMDNYWHPSYVLGALDLTNERTAEVVAAVLNAYTETIY